MVTSPIPIRSLLRLGESLTKSRKGSGRAHQGVDLYAAEGTPVVSPVLGVVVRVVNGIRGRETQRRAGWWVDIRAKDDLIHRLLHLGSDVRVKANDIVSPGMRIGTVGGRATSGIKHAKPHLHYEIAKSDYNSDRRDYGARIDPVSVLPIQDYLAARGILASMSDIDWKNILDKVLDIGGPIAGAVANAYAPGTGTLVNTGAQAIRKEVVDEYVPGGTPKPTAAPAVATAPKPASPPTAAKAASPTATDTRAIADFLLAKGWSQEQVTEQLKGPKPGGPPSKGTLGAPVQVGETRPQQQALMVDSILAKAGWSSEQRKALLDGPTALRAYQDQQNQSTLASLPPKSSQPSYAEDLITIDTNRQKG